MVDEGPGNGVRGLKYGDSGSGGNFMVLIGLVAYRGSAEYGSLGQVLREGNTRNYDAVHIISAPIYQCIGHV